MLKTRKVSKNRVIAMGKKILGKEEFASVSPPRVVNIVSMSPSVQTAVKDSCGHINASRHLKKKISS